MKKQLKTVIACGLLAFSAMSLASCTGDKYGTMTNEAALEAFDTYCEDVKVNYLFGDGKSSVETAITVGRAAIEGAKNSKKDPEAVANALASAKDSVFTLSKDALVDCCHAIRDGETTDETLAKLQTLSDAIKEDYTTNIYPVAESLITSAKNVYMAYYGYEGFVEQTEKFIDQYTRGATGVFSFVSASYEVRMQIIAALEKYAMNNYLTGIPLCDDGGYAMYSPDLKKGSDTYITGYGYGNLAEGSITADLESESKTEWKRYYHTYSSTDDKTINYANSQGSTVGTNAAYINGGYWETRMNKNKDGYEYFNSLAKTKPIAVNADTETGLATKYKWQIRTGADGFKYNTNSTVFSAYNGRDVEAEDYLTTYKMLYTKANGYVRGSENLTGSGSIKGTQAYYNNSAEGFNADAWENVGLKVYQDSEDNEWYMEVEFNSPCNTFFCMYYMSPTITPVCPEDFIYDLGGGTDAAAWAAGCQAWGTFNLSKGYTPVDTTLSTGAYCLERWDADQQIVYKRNPYFTDDMAGSEYQDRYQIAGVHINILTAAQSDSDAGLKEFLDGKIHAVGVPSKHIDEYKDDPRAVFVPGGTSWKLNLNCCTQETWNSLFGVNGTVSQCASEEDYWDCEPMMSNSDFYWGLFYSVDRTEFADTLGCGPSITYFGDDYLGDPENGVVYNNSSYHKEIMEDITDVADDGYSLEVAKAYFKKACTHMIKAGEYSTGDTITISMHWMEQALVDTYGKPLENYFESAFNSCGGGLTLDITHVSYTNYMDCYQDMMDGQYDIGFGSISGNAYDPLNFMEVLKSDNSSGYTLNWSTDTSTVDVEYDGKLWSFDSLWQAGDTGGYFENGVLVPSFEVGDLEGLAALDADMNATEDDASVAYYAFTIPTNMLTGHEEEGLTVSVDYCAFDTYAIVDGSAKYKEFDYDSSSFTVDEDGYLTLVVPVADFNALYGENNYYGMYYYDGAASYFMVDIIFNVTVKGVTAQSYGTCSFWLS